MRISQVLALLPALLSPWLVSCEKGPAQEGPVVAIATPPPPPEAAPAQEPAKAELPGHLAGIAGVWQDMETLDRHTIRERGGKLTVTSVVDSDGNALELRGVEWKDGVLEWSYHVESTGYTVRMTTERVEGDTLWCKWANHEASGDQELHRVK